MTRNVDSATTRVEKLETALRRGRELVEQMDWRMPEHATEDEDGWINSYRIPVGPWHRLLAWARDGALQPPGTPEEPNPMHEALTRIQEICRNDPDAVNAATTCEAIATHALGQSL